MAWFDVGHTSTLDRRRRVTFAVKISLRLSPYGYSSDGVTGGWYCLVHDSDGSTAYATDKALGRRAPKAATETQSVAESGPPPSAPHRFHGVKCWWPHTRFGTVQPGFDYPLPDSANQRCGAGAEWWPRRVLVPVFASSILAAATQYGVPAGPGPGSEPGDQRVRSPAPLRDSGSIPGAASQRHWSYASRARLDGHQTLNLV